MIRNAAFAGSFYPASAPELTEQIKQFAEAAVLPTAAIGVLAPHAGYVYSGKTACHTFQRACIPQTAVVLSPNHTGRGASIAMYTKGMWRTPLGEALVDPGLADELQKAIPGAKSDFAAHDNEHALEVQLPFLQYFRKDVRIVPITLKHLGLERCREIGQAIGAVLQKRLPDAPLLVASSDMTHYESAEVARAKDRRAIEQLLQLSPEGLYRTVEEGQISMCGVIPATVMLYAAKILGASRAELVRYSNSGEINGETERVVGYAGIIIR